MRGEGANARRLREIGLRLRKLTPAPWSVTGDGGVRCGPIRLLVEKRHAEVCDLANAEFAANARDDVPWLVARVKQLEGALREARANLPELARAAKDGDDVGPSIFGVLTVDPLEEE